MGASKMVIEVLGGCVTIVYADGPVEVVVVDWDNEAASHVEPQDMAGMDVETQEMLDAEDEDTVSDDDGEGLDEEVLTVW